MNPNYIAFILAYDYAEEFEALDLPCDDAFELAQRIAYDFNKWMKENDDRRYSEYELLQQFCEEISFSETWKNMHPDWDFRWRYKE